MLKLPALIISHLTRTIMNSLMAVVFSARAKCHVYIVMVRNRVKVMFIFLGLQTIRILILFLCYVPILKDIILDRFSEMSHLSNVPLNDKDRKDMLLSAGHVQYFYRTYMLDMGKTVHSGESAVDIILYKLDGKNKIKLANLMTSDLPLVVNFGSCTSPNFMDQYRYYHQLSRAFSDLADFVTVYTEEAFPVDIYNCVGNGHDIKEHQTLQERCVAASTLSVEFPELAVYVDAMDNAALRAYGAPNGRLYILHRGRVVYQGGLGPVVYDLDEVRCWLADYLVDEGMDKVCLKTNKSANHRASITSNGISIEKRKREKDKIKRIKHKMNKVK